MNNLSINYQMVELQPTMIKSKLIFALLLVLGIALIGIVWIGISSTVEDDIILTIVYMPMVVFLWCSSMILNDGPPIVEPRINSKLSGALLSVLSVFLIIITWMCIDLTVDIKPQLILIILPMLFFVWVVSLIYNLENSPEDYLRR